MKVSVKKGEKSRLDCLKKGLTDGDVLAAEFLDEFNYARFHSIDGEVTTHFGTDTRVEFGALLANDNLTNVNFLAAKNLNTTTASGAI